MRAWVWYAVLQEQSVEEPGAEPLERQVRVGRRGRRWTRLANRLRNAE